MRKLYAQASQRTINIREVLKIEETFLNFQAKKIENIQKIINGEDKPKPKINMTTKGPSRKQVIISMNNNNKIKFIEDSCNHVTNINRVLKSIKLEVMVNFIYSDQLRVIIITNKVVFQTIKSYIKNAKHIKAEEVKVPWLT